MPPLPTDRVILGLPGRVVFTLLVLAAIVAFVYSASRRIRVLLAGRPDNRFTRIGERIWRTLEYAFAQKRMFRDFYAGVFHILIFSGFVVLTVRTVALVVEGLVPGFVLLPGAAGNAYMLVKDIFEVLTLLGVGMAVFRRAFARPKRLDLTTDAWIILFLIAFLMVTDLVAEAARTALDPSLRTAWAPAVAAIAGWLSGVSAVKLQALYEWSWWGHLLDILIFGNFLPYSKHFHIITAIPNVFALNLAAEASCRRSGPRGQGRARGADRSADHRPHRGRTCSTSTPAPSAAAAATTARRTRTGKKLSPKHLTLALRDHLYAREPIVIVRGHGRGPVACRADGATRCTTRTAEARTSRRITSSTSFPTSSTPTCSGPARPAAPARSSAR